MSKPSKDLGFTGWSWLLLASCGNGFDHAAITVAGLLGPAWEKTGAAGGYSMWQQLVMLVAFCFLGTFFFALRGQLLQRKSRKWEERVHVAPDQERGNTFFESV